MKNQSSSAKDNQSPPDKDRELLNLLHSEIDAIKRVKQKSKNEIKLSQESQQKAKEFAAKINP